MYKKGWTRQKVMNVIRQRNKGERSVYDERYDECGYRSPDGNACLVGCFIPDDKYESDMEGKNAREVINRYGLHDFMPMREVIMSRLQTYHDYDIKMHMVLSGEDAKGEAFFNAIENYLKVLEKRYAQY